MRMDDGETDATSRADADDMPVDLGARRRVELRRRVDEGYYLTPRLTWEVARRIAESRER